jgi:hypothetical protein
MSQRISFFGDQVRTSRISSNFRSLTSFSTVIGFGYGPLQATVVCLGSRTLAELGFAVNVC